MAGPEAFNAETAAQEYMAWRALLASLDGLQGHQIEAVQAFAEALKSDHASPALSDAEFVRTRLGVMRGEHVYLPGRWRR